MRGALGGVLSLLSSASPPGVAQGPLCCGFMRLRGLREARGKEDEEEAYGLFH